VSKRILVTGGAGFVGSHLCERLLELGHEVIGLDNFYTGGRDNVRHLLDNPQFSLVEADVNDMQALRRAGLERLDEAYHLACPASPVHYQRDAVFTLTTCVLGTLNLLEISRDAGAKLLVASTSEVYGDPEPGHHPQVESYWGHVNPIGPRACYDEGKRCGEALAINFARQHGLQLRLPRIFNTYGPRMDIRDGRVVSNFVVQALCGEALTVYGEGQQTRSFCYVSDLVQGFLRLMDSKLQALPVNLGNPGEFTILELARLVLELTGAASGMQFEPLPENDPRQRRPDITRARQELGWEPMVPLEQGLKTTIAYFKQRLDL
jgi:UDP-glucuronate decarboxylase